VASIKFLDDELMMKLNSVELIREHLQTRKAEIDAYNAEHKVDRSNLVNGRHMTNIGVFREYARRYLSKHPMVNKEMTFMVRHLQPSEKGLPIEIYCFSKDKRWEYYEGIMADIFDHLLAVVPYFELSVFENPSGQDFQKLMD
jgi:miniconductance mechanosensitive channel